MSHRAPLKKLHLACNYHHKFSTFPQQILHEPQQLQLLYKNLLEICLNQCKKIQSRRLFDEMPQRVLFSLKLNKKIHSLSMKLGFSSEGKLGDAIVDLYGKCGDLEYAEKAFSRLEWKGSTLAWNSILSLYSRRGLLEGVVERFRGMMECGVRVNQFSFAIVLSACGRLMNLVFGAQLHCDVIKTGFEFDSFCEGALIDMYAKCASLDDARRVYDQAVEPDMVSWTAMVSGYVSAGLLAEAVKVFEDMLMKGCMPDQVAFVTVINACTAEGRLDDASRFFSLMHNPNVVAWNVMISGHAKRGYEEKAIQSFKHMIRTGIQPSRSTLGSVLSAIARIATLEYGLQVHAQAIKQGLDDNVYVGSSLISMYSKCQEIEAAKKAFDVMGEKNNVSWNALLGGLAQNGYAHDVMELFMNMRFSGFEPNDFTYTSILSACACLRDIEVGCQVHAVIIKNKFDTNLYVGNAIVDMYAKCGSLDDANQQFELLTTRDHISWNAIIVGYVQEAEEDEAFSLFQRMMLDGIAPDEVSLASILSACAGTKAFAKGKQIHCFLVKYGLETGLYAAGSLIDMYCKCGDTAAATEVFCFMPDRSVVSFNALIAGHAKRDVGNAVDVFKSMLVCGLKPSEVTFASLLESCNHWSGLNLGRQLHCSIMKLGLPYDDEFLAVALLGMYAATKNVSDTHILFSEVPNPKSTVIWTSVISGLAQNYCCEEALLWYQEMRKFNAMPDQATFASVLKACSVSASFQDGRKLHSLIFHTGFNEDELTGSALVDMYAKCGDVDSSAQVFAEMYNKQGVILWNSMIVGYAKNGFADKVLQIFDEMKQKCVKPDEITFLGVLTACSHAGMVSKGRQVFDDMVTQYGIQPRMDHCACMIDLLGRWGFLEEAETFINNLDFEPDAMVWASYLAACRLHGNDVRGQFAAEKLIQLDPHNSSPYVLLSNIYAATGNWDGVNSVRREMKQKEVKKYPGSSWITLGQKTDIFVAGDESHQFSDDLYSLLKYLTTVMKDEDSAVGTELFIEDCEHCLVGNNLLMSSG
ncbi:hypothetical protein Leryth_011439 [Lithospermum erythrorhizon]|nr:hypothetical protein Leryth_011439 [Lithospermum erythrorhizon]